jgi:hypothetical protein
MSEDRKQPLWPWIVALLIGLPVLYVASFGPACWIGSRDATQPWASLIVISVYEWPLPDLATLAPCDSGVRALLWYAGLFGEDSEVLAIYPLSGVLPPNFP